MKRRRKKHKKLAWHVVPFDILDITALTLVFVLWFFSLRLFHVFDVTTSACAELAATFGSSAGQWPVFKMLLAITILTAVYWMFVAILRIINNQFSHARIVWHFSVFIALGLIAIFTRSMVPSYNMAKPDGIMVAGTLRPHLKLSMIFDGHSAKTELGMLMADFPVFGWQINLT